MTGMRGWIAFLGVVAALSIHGAAAVTFDAPAGLGDREVRLTWQPDADDPLFTGNLEIFFEGRLSVGDGEITQLLFDRFGANLWALSRDGQLVVGLVATTGGGWVLDTLLTPLPEGAEIVCADLHPEGALLAAGLADGRVAVWRPGVGAGVSLYDAHESNGAGRACRGLRFAPLAVAADSSFVSVGDDGRLIEWLQPGDQRRQVQLSTEALTAVGLLREGRDESAAVGSASGRLSLYRLGTDVTRILDLDASPGREIRSILFSRDNRRMVSADALGGVAIWDARTGAARGRFQATVEGPISVAFTPRASDYLAYATQGGEIGVLDGYVATRFNVFRNLGRSIDAFALSPDGLIGYFGGAAGEVEWWHQGQCVPSASTPDCFGGYIVWRGALPDTSDLVWMRTYQFGDTTWNWTVRDTLRSFVDPDSLVPRGGDPDRVPAGPHNGIPYYYSLTKYRRVFSAGQEYLVLDGSPGAKEKGFYRTDPEEEPMPLVPRVDYARTRPLLGRVFVAPDPYIENDPASHFAPQGAPHVRFYHLPETATVRIYTAAGDLVRRLEHRQTPGGEAGGSLAWDLRNEHGQNIVAGVYFYSVETPSGESKTGYLTVVR